MSGKRPYRDIILDTISVYLLLKVAVAITSWFMKRFWEKYIKFQVAGLKFQVAGCYDLRRLLS
jgi:hypothetical protein